MKRFESIVASLERAASKHAARAAIEAASGESTTYAALFDRARDFARHVAPGTVVALDLPRSADLVIATLGAWIAGAAFTSFGAAQPIERRAKSVAAIAREGLDVVDAGSPARAFHASKHAVSSEALEPDDLAYVLFTSGSSGAPKGVLVEHRGLPGLVRAQVEAFALEPGARVLWMHAPVFDASISDVCTALAAGATLVLSDDAPARVRETIAARGVTHVDLPTSLLSRVASPPESLRVVVLGGEACDVDAVRELARSVRVVVVYGPTEATVCSSLAVVDPARWTEPLIGDPIAGVVYEVRDGELWIGGDGVARGYAGEVSPARFVTRDGARWYRTGDRVELTPHGLAFRGRLDRQVKFGGRRVELGEVEAIIAACDGVREVVVDLQRSGAHLVARVAGDIDVISLRAELATKLPSFMIPRRIDVLSDLPRTETGKVAPLVEDDAVATAQTDDIAGKLEACFRVATGRDIVAPTDRLRAAGADSFATLTFIAEAEARGVAIDLAALEGDPTFAELVDHARASNTAPQTVAACEALGLERARVALSGVARVARRGEPNVVFTGATGLFGSRLLRAWRARDPRRVVCLVRARDDRAAQDRLEQALGEIDCDPTNVEARAGDLSLPRFGLGVDAWSALAESVEEIVHAAAVVQLDLGWSEAAANNVGGAVEIARLAAASGARWHHVSTLAVFVATDAAAGRHASIDVPRPNSRVFGAYAASKIAAEVIARAHGATTIARLGLLIGGARSQLAMTARGLVKLGAVPRCPNDLRFDATPIDDAASAVCAHALERNGARTSHVASARGAGLGDLARAIRDAGIDLAELSVDAWAMRARALLADADVAMAYLALGRLHLDGDAWQRLRAFDLFLATGADLAPDVALPAADLKAFVRDVLARRGGA